ncbi:MAG: nucleotidyltransferase domain-containing protein [Nanoarchaeota archaeon]
MLSETEWVVIELLTKRASSPTEVAKALKTSIQNANTVLKKLEQKKLAVKALKSGKTRPFTQYSIGKGFIYFIQAVPGKAERKFVEVDDHVKVHLSIWSIPQKEFHYYIDDFWWGIKRYWSKIKCIVVFGSVARGDARKDSDIDVMILTHRKEKGMEKKLSAFLAGTKENNRIVTCQVFTMQDFETKLKYGDKLVREILTEGIAIYDPQNYFSTFKNGP